MESQTRSEDVSARAGVSSWEHGVATPEPPILSDAPPARRAVPLPFAALRCLVDGWSRCETVVAAYLVWMTGLWLASGIVDSWKWARLDLLVLGYLALISLAAPARRVVAHPLGRLTHSMFLLWAVLPLAYRQSGYFGTRFRPSVEGMLIRMDRAWFGIDWLTRHPPAPSWTGRILETVYLANYGLVLGCLSVLLLAAAYVGWRGWRGVDPQRLNADAQAVLTALIASLFACYALFPLLPAITPRLFFAQLGQPPEDVMRAINGWFLSRDSIPWGIFPCAHVAGIAAIGCAFWTRRWFRAAAVYFCAAALTAVSTVHGDYHFACDAAAGAAVGVTVAMAVLSASRRREPAFAVNGKGARVERAVET